MCAYEAKPGGKGAFPGPVWLFVRLKRSWSSLVARLLWLGFYKTRKLCQLVPLFMFPPLNASARSHPILRFKYLRGYYLIRGLTLRQRASCFRHHYRRLRSLLPRGLLHKILSGSLVLHELSVDGHCFSITMGLSQRDCIQEGELSLNLYVDGEIVFVLSFTIVPGSVVESEVEEILLITRIQGAQGRYSQISLATKVLHDVAPRALLLSALKGIALAFGIGHMSGVCASRQTSYCEGRAAHYQRAYDAFLAGSGFVRNPAGFYLAALPFEEKPLACIKRGHKLRTKEKRLFKQQIQFACASFFGKVADLALASSGAAWQTGALRSEPAGHAPAVSQNRHNSAA